MIRVFFGMVSPANTPKPCTADLPRTIFGDLGGRRTPSIIACAAVWFSDHRSDLSLIVRNGHRRRCRVAVAGLVRHRHDDLVGAAVAILSDAAALEHHNERVASISAQRNRAAWLDAAVTVYHPERSAGRVDAGQSVREPAG